MSTQLRRYQIKPGQMEGFLEHWRDAARLREAHGFHVLFAFVDEAADEFTWAFRNDVDPDEAQERFQADPKRQALLALSEYVQDSHVCFVRVEPVPSG